MTAAPAPHMLVSDVNFPKLKEYVLDHTGLNYYYDKDSDFAERISRRMDRLAIKGCSAYLVGLQAPEGAKELDFLISELTIGETYFFRHVEQFDALRDIIIPEILMRNQNSRSLRIWSAGCSNGAEPYSISILLKTHFLDQIRGWNVSIVGTDINKAFLAQARIGGYEEWAFRGTSADLRARCFTPMGKKWILAPEFRQHVSFQYHNLITDPFPSVQHNLYNFDLILCRNVVIYFSQDRFAKLVSQFEATLAEGGWLLVGHSEPNTEVFRAFHQVSAPGAILYKRKHTQESGTGSGLSATLTETWQPASFGNFAAARHLVHEQRLPMAAKAPQLDSAPIRPLLQGKLPSDRDLDAVRLLANQGQWDKAEACCKEIISREPLNSKIHFYYGLILQHLGRNADSEQALRRTVYLDRNFVLAHYYLGLCQKTKLDCDGAARSFDTVLRLLSSLPPDHELAEADGIISMELKEMAQTQLEALNACGKQSTGS